MIKNFFDDIDKMLYEILEEQVNNGTADPLSAKILYESWIFRFIAYVVAVVSAGIGAIKGFTLGVLKVLRGESK